MLAGCGPDVPTADVSGTISVAGKPPGDGYAINFVGVTGQTVSTPVAPDGTYRAEKVPVGEVQVGFTFVTAQDAEKSGARPDPKKKVKPKDAKTKLPFADRYTDPRTSGLALTVKPKEENKFDHNLTK